MGEQSANPLPLSVGSDGSDDDGTTRLRIIMERDWRRDIVTDSDGVRSETTTTETTFGRGDKGKGLVAQGGQRKHGRKLHSMNQNNSIAALYLLVGWCSRSHAPRDNKFACNFVEKKKSRQEANAAGESQRKKGEN